MDRLETMQMFVRVAEMGSFTRAAESLGRTKAGVSLSVQQLEAGLGVRLLHRTTRKVQLTQDGTLYYERCKDLLADFEEAESMFQQKPADAAGRIRVDMPTGVARNIVVPALPEFLNAYPKIEVELSCTDRKVDVIREGFDCVIRVGSVADSGLILRSLGAFTIVNCVSPAYLAKRGKPKTLEDLAKHSMIHYVPTLGSRPDGFEYPDGKGYRCQAVGGRVFVNNADAYLAACLAGFGIIQVPLVGVKQHLAEGSLVEVLPKHRAEPMPVSLIYPHRRHLARRVQLFMDWVDAKLRSAMC